MQRDASEAPSSASVYIVTLNWNRCDDTLALLQSLQNLTYPNFHTIVIDNGSVDGSVAHIRESYPHVIQICNGKNLGFGRGFNIGMQYALDEGADYIFIINNDTIVDPQVLTHLMNHASPKIGILAPLIYLASDPERIWSGGGRFSCITLEVNLDLENKLDPGLPEITERDFVTGCAMLFSADVLRKVGLFDEHFTLYYEDLDLCRRVWSAKYPIRLIATAKMWHKVSQSSGGKYSVNERYWMARSSVKYFRKHMLPANLPFVLFHRLASAVKLSLILTLKGQFPPLAAYWKGLYHGLRDLRG
jgi:hypothetical protein